MSDLSAFLLARLAEDEAAAKAAGSDQRVTWATTANAAASAAGADAGLFILFNDPARVLADVEAKRRIVGLHPSYGGYGERCATCQSEDDLAGDPWPCPTLRALASVYADHPEFREEWR